MKEPQDISPNLNHQLYISSADYVEQNNTASFNFNKSGKKTDSPKEKVFGKIVVNNDKSNYYIRVHQSVPYDPLGTYGKREQYLETKMVKTSQSTFDFYMLYLQTKNTIYMSKARRGLTNG